ncbi:MAG: hypothetical protein IPM91_02150 [Bacteroidetes bacterium]|nr:hypothetical protein [Bacteroidota bacterium]
MCPHLKSWSHGKTKTKAGGSQIIPQFSSPSHPEEALPGLISEKFGHIGTAILLTNCENISSSKYFQLTLGPSFFSALTREYNIQKDEFMQVIDFCADELLLYDRYLLNKGTLFSVDLLRNFHKAGYFRNRKYKAEQILSGVNFLRPHQQPLTLEENFEYLMANLDQIPELSDGDKDDDGLPF